MSVYLGLVKHPILAIISNHIDGYPTPINLSYMWSFGSLAGLALVIQIITGVLLAMHYAPEVHLAFASVEHIMRDVRGGVALRYIHANGASMFFIVVYLHMFRGLYYGSYFQPRANLWYSGIVIFFLMMATAFMGYVLPWGQMSFWGATVITNLFSAIPAVGNQIVQLLWGGFSVDNPTLNRFFSFHYLVPFLIAAMALMHLVLLHQNGSNNPLGIFGMYDKIPFYPYYYTKDLFAFFIFVWIFSFFVIYAPNYMGHPDNYIEANPLVTPAHIVPEWYFLPFYAVLRTIPDKLGGVVLMGIAIIILALLPVADTSVFRSNFFKPLNIIFFWIFFSDSLSLGWIGQEIVESPFIEMANFVTSFYFLYFIPILPLIGVIESLIINTAIKYSANEEDVEFETDYFSSAVSQTANDERTFIGQNSYAILPFICLNFGNFNLNTFDFLILFISWANILQIGLITLFLLVLSILFTRNGQFALLMNKLIVVYIFFNILMSFDINMLQSINIFTLGNGQDYIENNIYFPIFIIFAYATVGIFFYGIIDRFFIANSYEIEYAIVVLLILLGALFLFRVSSFIEFLIAIEIVTFSTFILVAYEHQNRFSVYAGVQYFILSSVPSAMLILAISLIYNMYGIMHIKDLDLIANSTSNLAELSDKNFIALTKIAPSNALLKLPFKPGTLVYNIMLEEVPSKPSRPKIDEVYDFEIQNFLTIKKSPHLARFKAGEPIPVERADINRRLANGEFYTWCYLKDEVPLDIKPLPGLTPTGHFTTELILEYFGVNPKTNPQFKERVWSFKIFKTQMAIDTIVGADRLYPYSGSLVNLKGSKYTVPTPLQCYTSNIKIYKFINGVHSTILEVPLPNTKNINWENLLNSVDFKEHKSLGIILFFSFNLLFKLTAAPFHFWALSIYEKAPISSVTILSIFTKLMIIFLILKVYYTAFFAFKSFIGIFFILLSILTALVAIIGAFTTPILKKFFVYSSMGHVAFMLIPLAFFSIGSSTATIHYLAVYIISSFIMWFILYIKSRDNHTLIFFKQLKTSDPLLGLIFAMLIFSMSGIPPFGGFYVKLDVLTLLLEQSNFYVTFILFLCTVASFFYYLRLIKIIYFDNKEEYSTTEILSTERVYIVIVLFLVLTFYSYLVQVPLLYSEIEFLKSYN